MSASPTELSMKEMRKRGYLVQVTERWNAFAKIRVDLFGFIDVLCVKKGEIVGVQATSYSNVPARVNKIADHENTPIVREAGIRILVMGWRKDSNNRWTFREVDCS